MKNVSPVILPAKKCKGLTANDCLECPTYLIKYPPAYDTAG